MMEDFKKKYAHAGTFDLNLRYEKAGQDEKEIIYDILKKRGIDPNSYFPKDIDDIDDIDDIELTSTENIESISTEITTSDEIKLHESTLSDINGLMQNKKEKDKNLKLKIDVTNSNGKHTSLKPYEERKDPQFYKLYVKFLNEYGSDAAVIIAMFASHQQYYNQFNRVDENGYFYFEHHKIEKLMGISKYRQKIAMQLLTELGILMILDKKKGIPPKKFYKVDMEKYEKVVQSLSNE